MTTTTDTHEPVTAAEIADVLRAATERRPEMWAAAHGMLASFAPRLARDLAAARAEIEAQATAIANVEEERDAHGILTDKLELQLNCPAHAIPRRVEALLRLARLRGAAVARLRAEVASLRGPEGDIDARARTAATQDALGVEREIRANLTRRPVGTDVIRRGKPSPAADPLAGIPEERAKPREGLVTETQAAADLDQAVHLAESAADDMRLAIDKAAFAWETGAFGEAEIKALVEVCGTGPHDREDCPCQHPKGTTGPCAGCNCADFGGAQ